MAVQHKVLSERWKLTPVNTGFVSLMEVANVVCSIISDITLEEITTEFAGLEKSIVDSNTGATTNFHHIDSYSVDIRVKQIYIQSGCYISNETYSSGKNSVTVESVLIDNIKDPSIITLEHLYNLLVTQEQFSGATIIEG